MRKNLLFVVTALTLLSLMVFASDQRDSNGDMERKIEEMRAQEKERLERLMPMIESLLDYDIELLQAALKIRVMEKYQGAVIVLYDSLTKKTKYLGSIEDQFTANSIFNEYGTYGSEYSTDSIWNAYGSYGGKYSTESPFNKFTSTPPMIVKDRETIGYLTVNKFIQGGVPPSWLKSFFVY